MPLSGSGKKNDWNAGRYPFCRFHVSSFTGSIDILIDLVQKYRSLLFNTVLYIYAINVVNWRYKDVRLWMYVQERSEASSKTYKHLRSTPDPCQPMYSLLSKTLHSSTVDVSQLCFLRLLVGIEEPAGMEDVEGIDSQNNHGTIQDICRGSISFNNKMLMKDHRHTEVDLCLDDLPVPAICQFGNTVDWAEIGPRLSNSHCLFKDTYRMKKRTVLNART